MPRYFKFKAFARWGEVRVQLNSPAPMNSLYVTFRRALSPIARPLWRRIRPRIMRVTDLFKLSDAWHQHAPALINAAASVGAVAKEQQRMKREYDEQIAQLKAEIAELRAALERRTGS